jgi:nucleoid-associated protein YgaU
MKRRSEIYRRRRLGASLAVSAIVYVLYINAGADAGTEPVSYTVEHGDTLWKIATEHYPRSEDPRAAIEAIREENGLDGYGIRQGTRLELPR